MQFLINGEDIKSLRGYIFCDNDFLSMLFNNEDFLIELLGLLNEKSLFIDSYTRIEFLRDVSVPKSLQIKEEFLGSFIEAEDHVDIYKTIKNNALILSYLYAHNKRAGASLIDLFLAARMMGASYRSYIVTGNKKDFPSFIFDTISVINYEQKDGSMRAISILQFNKDKFEKTYEQYRETPFKD